jgi:hypothetical protein
MRLRVSAIVVAVVVLAATSSARGAEAQEPTPDAAVTGTVPAATATAAADGSPQPATTPLGDAIEVGDCDIPAGYTEVTSGEATKRGQRVFEDPGGAHRLYVRADGSCVSLAAIPPLPDYAPEGNLGANTTAIADTTGVEPSALPSTGTSSVSRDNAVLYLISIAATIALTATVLPLAVLALKRN